MKRKWVFLNKSSFLNRLKNNEKGGALLMLLVLIPVLALGAMAAYHYSSNRTDIIYYDFHRQQARYVAEAGLQRLIAEIEFNNGFVGTLDDIPLTGEDAGDIPRYGKEGPIQFLGGDNQDLISYSPIKPQTPSNQLTTLLNFFSVTEAHAASYGTGATYEVRLIDRVTTDPFKKIYEFEATAKTYPTDIDPGSSETDVVVEEQIVTMKVEVSSTVTPPPPPTCDESTTCTEGTGGGCNTKGDDGFYRYTYFAGNDIAHTGTELFFGTKAAIDYHAGNQYNSVDYIINGSCKDESTLEQKGRCKDSRPFCRENDDIVCLENDDMSGDRTGLSFMSCDCMMGLGTYGCNECIEAEKDIKIDCPAGFMFMTCTGFRGDYYGDSSTCDNEPAPPQVAFENVIGSAYGTDGDYNLDAVKQLILEKVSNGTITNGDSSSLDEYWNTGDGDFRNYHYWKAPSGASTLSNFNFFNTKIFNNKNNVYYIEGSIEQFNLTSGDMDLLHVLSRGSITIIAENDITLYTGGTVQFDFLAKSAASLNLIAGNDLKEHTTFGMNFRIGQASETNLIALNNITLKAGMEFNFSINGNAGLHVAALKNLSLNDGFNITFGWNKKKNRADFNPGNWGSEPDWVKELCDTTGCIEDNPEDPIPGNSDVNILEINFG